MTRRRTYATDHAILRYRERIYPGISDGAAINAIEFGVRHAVPASNKELAYIRRTCKANAEKVGPKNNYTGWMYWVHRAEGVIYVCEVVGAGEYRVVTVLLTEEKQPPKKNITLGVYYHPKGEVRGCTEWWGYIDPKEATPESIAEEVRGLLAPLGPADEVSIISMEPLFVWTSENVPGQERVLSPEHSG